MKPGFFERFTVKGIEILTFNNVVLEKIKEDDTPEFSIQGNFNVIYFHLYDLFLLQLNDWRYALLPMISTSGLRELGTGSYIYTFPTINGTYLIRMHRTTNSVALKNLDTILTNTTNFRCPKSCYDILQGDNKTSAEKKGPYSPRIITQEEEDRYYADVMNNSENNGPERKRERFKKKFKKIVKSFTAKFKEPRENINLSYIRTFEGMKVTTKEMAPRHKFCKKEIETSIIFSNSIVKKFNHVDYLSKEQAHKEKSKEFEKLTRRPKSYDEIPRHEGREFIHKRSFHSKNGANMSPKQPVSNSGREHVLKKYKTLMDNEDNLSIISEKSNEEMTVVESFLEEENTIDRNSLESIPRYTPSTNPSAPVSQKSLDSFILESSPRMDSLENSEKRLKIFDERYTKEGFFKSDLLRKSSNGEAARAQQWNFGSENKGDFKRRLNASVSSLPNIEG